MLLRDWPNSRSGCKLTVFEAGRRADLQLMIRSMKLASVCPLPAPIAITASVAAAGHGSGPRLVTTHILEFYVES
jgi:hypothetical protein